MIFKRVNWKLWLGIFISLIALIIVFHRVEWDKLSNALLQVNLGFVLLGIFSLTCELIIRAVRWRVLLYPLGKFHLKDCFIFYMIGYMSNLLLPFRAGEIIRPYLFGQKKGIAKSAVLATVVVERLFDIISLLLVFTIVATVMVIPPEMQQSVYVVEGVAIVMLMVLWLMLLEHKKSNRVANLLSRFPVIGVKLKSWFISATTGFSTLHNIRAILATLLISWVIWATELFVIQSYLLAFGLELPWYTPLFIIVVTSLGMMIPSSPGYIGVIHFLYVFSLSFFGVDKNIALAFAIVIHGISFAVIILVGLISIWFENLSFSRITALTPTDK
ncbi:lysylphosphatidylglycerol synthase transmembrane domain-containing protein [Thiotrichales bacterium HSG14]|nr:lysylphosphatidylglycerol synthase transmembrane domain-containing protein [Thiotrichales bacterium HSG14]